MKKIWKFISLIIVFFCVFFAVTKVYEYFHFQEHLQKPFPNGLPNSDIVFVPLNSTYSGDNNSPTLGFIKLDGSEHVEYRFPVLGGSKDMIGRIRYGYLIGEPVWNREKNVIFFGVPDSGPNIRAITSEGNLVGQDCYLVTYAYPVSDGNIYGLIDENAPVWEMYRNQVLPNTNLWARISLEGCAITETFLLPVPDGNICWLYGETNDGRIVEQCVNLNNDEETIFLLDAKTGKKPFFFPGEGPSLSDDGKMLAYYGEYGSLRVRDLETGENKKLIVVGKGATDRYEHLGPPGWSPDGKWLVYNNTAGQIFKINIDTLEQVYLVDGWAPDWR